jgi:hypothetical protein
MNQPLGRQDVRKQHTRREQQKETISRPQNNSNQKRGQKIKSKKEE